MILLCGIPSEPPLAMVRDQLNTLNIPYVIFNQRNFAKTGVEFEIADKHITGLLNLGDRTYHLEDFSGVYTRLMDYRQLPEFKEEPVNSHRRHYCMNLHETLISWCDITPIRVVNRINSMGSNFSKPFQAQLIRKHGFSVPDTLITNDPAPVYDFYNQHRRLIYKSISGIRSIVQTMEDKDFEHLGQIRWCPTQFQKFIDGINIRVHTIASECFATAIDCDATDYRYSHRQNSDEAKLEAVKLPNEIAEKCIRLTKEIGLAFAGIDLIITPEDQVFCLEVNPSPAFNYYEVNTGQPIAQAVAQYLAG